jgi:hypothetical protein
MYARTIQSTLRRYGPLDLPTLIDRCGFGDEDSNAKTKAQAGLKFSRHNTSNEDLSNEIVVSARDLSGNYIYFLAANDEEAEEYEVRRKVIALGHIQSVICLEEKRYERWPTPQRQAAIKMLEMAHVLLSTSA